MKMIRSADDERQDEFNLAAAIDCSVGPGARQEFKDDADINVIMDRMMPFAPRPVSWGQSVDYDFDLAELMRARMGVQQVFNDLPPQVRSKFTGVAQFVQMAESGKLEEVLSSWAAAASSEGAAGQEAPPAGDRSTSP